MKFGENLVKQPQGLIEVLLDVAAAEAERDDAAMDLAAYDEPEVEDALIHVGADASTLRPAYSRSWEQVNSQCREQTISPR